MDNNKLFYQVQIEIKEKDKNKDNLCYYELDKTDKNELLNNIILPFVKNEEFIFNGYFLKKDKISRLLVKTTKSTTKELSDYENYNLPRNLIMYIPPEAILAYKEYTTDITQEILSEARDMINSKQRKSEDKEKSKEFSKVFIVHGHDVLAKTEIARFIEQLGFEAIILSEQPNVGKTIIEKIEQNTNVDFGIVLYTPCDIGGEKKSKTLKLRARQNVVFEHGYLIGKLGRERQPVH